MTYHSYDDIPIYNLAKCAGGDYSFVAVNPYNTSLTEDEQKAAYKSICATPNGLRNESLEGIKIKANDLESMRFCIDVMRQFKPIYLLKDSVPQEQRDEIEALKKQLLKRVRYFGLGIEDELNIAIAESYVEDLGVLYDKMKGNDGSLTVNYVMKTAAKLAAKPYSMDIDVHKTNATSFFLKLEEAMKIATDA